MPRASALTDPAKLGAVQVANGECGDLVRSDSAEAEAAEQLVPASDPGAVLAGGEELAEGFVLREPPGGILGLDLAVGGRVALSYLSPGRVEVRHREALLAAVAEELPGLHEPCSDGVVCWWGAMGRFAGGEPHYVGFCQVEDGALPDVAEEVADRPVGGVAGGLLGVAQQEVLEQGVGLRVRAS